MDSKVKYVRNKRMKERESCLTASKSVYKNDTCVDLQILLESGDQLCRWGIVSVFACAPKIAALLYSASDK